MPIWRGALLALLIVPISDRCVAGQFLGSWREYGIIGAALTGAAVLERWPPNDGHPLLGGEQKPYIERERVPDWALGIAHLAALSTIRFGPGEEDRIRHAHGYAMAASLTLFATSLTRGVVGRRRPNYEDAKRRGITVRSKSFFSGHASTSFCLATYGTFYTWHRTERAVYRIGVPVLLYGAATYAAWILVAEHRH